MSRGASRFVYFAHTRDGSRVKVGRSQQPERRVHEAGWTMIGLVPGDGGYEAAVHWALRAYRIEGEWFRSCAHVWRFSLDTGSRGKIAWLPAEPGYRAPPSLLDDCRCWFGSEKAAAEAVGLGVGAFATAMNYTPRVAWGRLYAEIARLEGRLPAYLEVGPAPPRRTRSECWTAERRAAHSLALREAWVIRRRRLAAGQLDRSRVHPPMTQGGR